MVVTVAQLLFGAGIPWKQGYLLDQKALTMTKNLDPKARSKLGGKHVTVIAKIRVFRVS